MSQRQICAPILSSSISLNSISRPHIRPHAVYAELGLLSHAPKKKFKTKERKGRLIAAATLASPSQPHETVVYTSSPDYLAL